MVKQVPVPECFSVRDDGRNRKGRGAVVFDTKSICRYFKIMDPEMIRKIDSVLDRVKDPESHLPVSRLGVIRRIRYSEEHKKLYVFGDFYPHLAKCITCSAIGLAIASRLVRDLTEEFQAEFPELSVEFV